MKPLDSDTLDRTALAALITIAGQCADGDITGPEARERLLKATRAVDALRRERWQNASPLVLESDETHHQKTARITAAMVAGDISPVIWESRLAQVAREELARTGRREVMS